MRKMQGRVKWLYMLCCIVFLFPLIAKCQPGSGDDMSDPDAPVDGGVVLLVAAGVGYGYKKYKKHKKELKSS